MFKASFKQRFTPTPSNLYTYTLHKCIITAYIIHMLPWKKLPIVITNAWFSDFVYGATDELRAFLIRPIGIPVC